MILRENRQQPSNGNNGYIKLQDYENHLKRKMEVSGTVGSYEAEGIGLLKRNTQAPFTQEKVPNFLKSNMMKNMPHFMGAFQPNMKEYEEPILVSGTDSVGTKLKIAFLMNEHASVGVDCVALCINELLCKGALPLFFSHYIAVGKNIPEKVEEIKSGIRKACEVAGCTLFGGKIAEIQRVHEKEEYDLAGFAVGIVDKKSIIQSDSIQEGDRLIGLASSGLHNTGFSLVRKLLNINEDASKLKHNIDRLGKTLAQELLTPTKMYVQTVFSVLKQYTVHGIAHITEGGMLENMRKIIPGHLGVRIHKSLWNELPVFGFLRDIGDLSLETMLATFNMGIGMILVVPKKQAEAVLKLLDQTGEVGYDIGCVVKGTEGYQIC